MSKKGTGKQATISPVSVPIGGAPDSFRTLDLVPGRNIIANLKQVPVTAGVSYTFAAPIAAGNAKHVGYATLVFLDGAGKGISRTFIWFGPGEADLGAATTNVDGRFTDAFRGHELRAP